MPNDNLTNNFSEFKIERISDFYHVTQLIDIMGFSIKRRCKNEGRGSIFHVYIKKEELEKKNDKKQLTIRGTYGAINDEDGSVQSVETKKITEPIDFISDDSYFYDINLNKFYKKNKEINPLELLEELYKIHTKPSRLFVGFWLRIKLIFWRKIATLIIKIFSNTSIWFLYFISGTKITSDIWHRIAFPDLIDEQFRGEGKEQKNPEIVDFFGYKVPLNTIALYCFLSLLTFFVLYFLNLKPPILKLIINNNFIALCYAILSLFIFDKLLLPLTSKILLLSIKKTSQFYYNLTNKKIKI